MNDEEELKKLNEEYKELKKKSENNEEIKVLKKKIWRLRHRNFVNIGMTLDNIYKGTKEMIIKKIEKKKIGDEEYRKIPKKINELKIIDIP